MHFGAPSILWALLALAIPVIVHLFDFRRYRKVQFSDNYLLQQLLEKNKRQSRLRRLIIMSLRMLFIAALVLAFAKPYFPQSNEPLSSGRLFVSIYVDNSLSMEVSDGKTDLLEKARSNAIEILNAYPPGTMFRLISNDFLGEHERFCPLDECADMLSLLDFCPFPRKLSAVVSRMSDLSDMNAFGAEHHFYIISDFQKSTADVALLASTDRKIFLFPVDAPKTPNISVDSIWFSGPVQLENNLITVNARIRNHSDMLLEKIPVRLYVDGKQKGLGDVELAASGSDVVEFTFTVNTRGSHEGYIEIDDSPISFDDRIFFAFDIASSVPVYHIAGSGATKHINNLFERDSLFNFTSVREGSFDAGSMASAGLVILDEVSQISSGMASELNRLLESGGNILIIPAAGDIKNYQSGFAALGIPAFAGIDTANTRVASIEAENPLFRGVFVTPPKQIQFPFVFNSYRIPKGNGRSIMTMLNGNSFMAEFTKGKGHIYLLSVPLQPTYSTFASNALIVPAFMQMAFMGRVMPGVAYSLDYSYGIDLPALVMSEEKPPVLTGFDGSSELIPGFSNGTPPRIFLNSRISTPGAYKVLQGEKTFLSFGLNYPRSESNTACFSTDEIEQIVGGNKKISVLATGATPAAVIDDMQEGLKLWKTFIIFALIFFAIELILLRIWI